MRGRVENRGFRLGDGTVSCEGGKVYIDTGKLTFCSNKQFQPISAGSRRIARKGGSKTEISV